MEPHFVPHITHTNAPHPLLLDYVMHMFRCVFHIRSERIRTANMKRRGRSFDIHVSGEYVVDEGVGQTAVLTIITSGPRQHHHHSLRRGTFLVASCVWVSSLSSPSQSSKVPASGSLWYSFILVVLCSSYYLLLPAATTCWVTGTPGAATCWRPRNLRHFTIRLAFNLIIFSYD